MNPIEELTGKVSMMETQVGFLVGQLESEKRTRAVVNSEFMRKIEKLESRITTSERYIFIGIGLILAAQPLLVIVLKFWK